MLHLNVIMAVNRPMKSKSEDTVSVSADQITKHCCDYKKSKSAISQGSMVGGVQFMT